MKPTCEDNKNRDGVVFVVVVVALMECKAVEEAAEAVVV
jgi:hypothetical protein